MSEYVLNIAGREYRAEVAELTSERARILVNGEEYSVDLVEIGRSGSAVPNAPRAPAASPPRSTTPSSSAPGPRPAAPPSGVGGVPAPLPGLVLEVKVKEGDVVSAGQPVVVMEAMKMENVVPAPHNGTVRKVFVANGDSVGEGDLLVEITRPEMTTL